MNKGKLIARVQRLMGAGTSRSTAQAAVNAVLDSILQEAQNQKVHLAHLGTFEYRERRASRRLSFRPAKRLKERTTGHCHAQPENTHTPTAEQ